MKNTLVALTFATLAMSLFAADGPYVPNDNERANWTMSDMRSWRICFDAYASDHHKYPEVKSAEEAKALFEPIYVVHLPMTDAWGRPYAVESDAKGYKVISSGADGKFDKASWSTGGALTSFDEDAVATQDGRWLFRHWTLSTK
jgi:hypothetical protein